MSMEGHDGMILTGEKTCPGVTFSTINPVWIDLGLCGERPATNLRSHGRAKY
jgi:hypothetical protein